MSQISKNEPSNIKRFKLIVTLFKYSVYELC
jgi:hypothetical protein